MHKWLKKANWLVVAGVVTVIYATALVSQLGWTNILTFISRSDELNETGDFFAGVFAPVALIWLVAAVFTQRQELNETRDQFEENRKVVDAQLKTINAQNALLQQQHRQAEGSARRTYRLNLFQERYRLYEDFRSLGTRHDEHHYTDAYEEMVELVQRASFLFGKEIEDWFGKIAEVIYENEKLRSEHTGMADDGMGNYRQIIHNEEIAKQVQANEAWLWEQFFLPNVRSRMFQNAMRVSDED